MSTPKTVSVCWLVVAFFLPLQSTSSARECASAIYIPGYIILIESDSEEEFLWRKLFRWNPDTHEKSIFWSGKSNISSVEISQDKVIAFLESGGWNDTQLRLLNPEGQTLRLIEGNPYIGEFSLSPNGRSIVYSNGNATEATFFGYSCTGVFILDIESGRTYRILEEAYDIIWPEFENAIYYVTVSENELQVAKLIVESGETVQTPYHATNFSLEGSFYYVPRKDISPFEVYRRDPHQNISNEDQNLLDYRFFSRLTPSKWLDDKRLSCMQTVGAAGPGKYFVMNVDAGDVRQARGRIVGACDENSALIILNTGQLTPEKYADMPKVFAESLPALPDGI